MNDPALPSKASADSTSPPRAQRVGPYRLVERTDVREVGALHIARRDGAASAELVWMADVGAWPEIGATWSEVVRAYESLRTTHALVPRAHGEQGSLRWLAFAPFVGESIAAMLKRLHSERATVPWQIACRIIADAAHALHALHQCRDGSRTPWPLHGALSGHSLSVGFDGGTVLFDPGHLFPIQAPSPEALPYSAPERVWSEPSDARADVFALGVLLWELCAGRRLFRGRDDDETRALLEAHVIPELGARVRAIPPSVDALLRRAVARTAEDRLATADDLAMEASALADGASVTSHEVAVYMRERFGDREREQRARLLAAGEEATEIRTDSGETPAILSDASTVARRAPSASSLTITREDVTVPRGSSIHLAKTAPSNAQAEDALVRSSLDPHDGSAFSANDRDSGRREANESGTTAAAFVAPAPHGPAARPGANDDISNAGNSPTAAYRIPRSEGMPISNTSTSGSRSPVTTPSPTPFPSTSSPPAAHAAGPSPTAPTRAVEIVAPPPSVATRAALSAPPAPIRRRLDSQTELLDEESITRRHPSENPEDIAGGNRSSVDEFGEDHADGDGDGDEEGLAATLAREPLRNEARIGIGARNFSDSEEQKTLPRISANQIPASAAVASEMLPSDALVPESAATGDPSTLDPITRRVAARDLAPRAPAPVVRPMRAAVPYAGAPVLGRDDNDESTNATPLQDNRLRPGNVPQPPRPPGAPFGRFGVAGEDATPTRVRPEVVRAVSAGAAAAAAAVAKRPGGTATAATALQRPATPLESAARPRRPSAGAIRVTRAPVEPVAVARPGPVPPPPRPQARSIPPVEEVSPPSAPTAHHPATMAHAVIGPAHHDTPNGPISAGGTGVLPPPSRPPPSLGGNPTINAPLIAPTGPTAISPQLAITGSGPAAANAGFPVPGGLVGAFVQNAQVANTAPISIMMPGQAAFVSEPPQAMQAGGFGNGSGFVAVPHTPMAPPQSHAMPAMMAQAPLPTTSDSVAFGPVVPIASTFVEEPAEKVIVDAPAPPLGSGFPPPRQTSANGMDGAGAPVGANDYVPPPRDGGLPRDPHMPAMQRALLARDSVRPERRLIALPVVIVALVLAVGVAIGIPLLSRKPTRIVDGATASAQPSGLVTTHSPPSAYPTSSPMPPVPTTPLGAVGAPNGAGTGAVGVVPGSSASVPPPPPSSSVAGVNPLALPDSSRGNRAQAGTSGGSSGSGGATRTTRRQTGSSGGTGSRSGAREGRGDRAVDDDDDAPLPKEFETRATPKENTGSSTSSSSGSAAAGKGLLTVMCSPPCDEVLDGSRSLGPSPVVKQSVNAGNHRLTLRISDPPMEKVVTVTVSPDETTFLTQPMSK